jgi:large subunit ribosomal protein L10e
MASLRKASSYSKKRVRPFTRKSNRRKKAYIKAVPQLKIVKYHMGNIKANTQGKYKFILTLTATEKAQLRDNALESSRTLINKYMDKMAPAQYYFNIKVYPHHVLRENKTAAGAGADRLSSGMKHSYGITIGRAAIVQPGSVVFYISAENEKSARAGRYILGNVKSKLPFKSRVMFTKVS